MKEYSGITVSVYTTNVRSYIFIFIFAVRVEVDVKLKSWTSYVRYFKSHIHKVAEHTTAVKINADKLAHPNS